MRSLGISELRLCARGARGRLGCSSDQVPAPLLSGVVHGLGNSQASPRARTAGRGAARRPWDAPVAREGPSLRAAAAQPGLGVWPARARLGAAAAWLAPARGQSDPPKRAPGQGQGHGASLARAPWGCFSSVCPSPTPLLSPPGTHPGGAGQRPLEKLRQLALLRSAPAPSLVLGLSRGPSWGAEPELPGGRLRLWNLGEYQPISLRAKLWLLYSSRFS